MLQISIERFLALSYSKMKKTVFFIVSCIFFFASCGQENKFDNNLREAFKEQNITFYASVLAVDEISSTWSKAIYDNRTPSGKYCSDFNEALEELYKSFEDYGITDSISKHKKNLESLASKLNNPPSTRKDCYDDFIELVSETNSFARMATNPSGSLRSYADQKNSSYERISKMIDQFKIKYGTIIEKKE